jgi:AFG3 family protein
LAQSLLEKETLDLTAILRILGERPFPPKSNFKEYLETKKIIEEEKGNEKKTKEAENIAQYQIETFKI